MMMDALLSFPGPDLYQCANFDHVAYGAILMPYEFTRTQETFKLDQVHGSQR